MNSLVWQKAFWPGFKRTNESTDDKSSQNSLQDGWKLMWRNLWSVQRSHSNNSASRCRRCRASNHKPSGSFVVSCKKHHLKLTTWIAKNKTHTRIFALFNPEMCFLCVKIQVYFVTEHFLLKENHILAKHWPQLHSKGKEVSFFPSDSGMEIFQHSLSCLCVPWSRAKGLESKLWGESACGIQVGRLVILTLLCLCNWNWTWCGWVFSDFCAIVRFEEKESRFKNCGWLCLLPFLSFQVWILVFRNPSCWVRLNPGIHAVYSLILLWNYKVYIWKRDKPAVDFCSFLQFVAVSCSCCSFLQATHSKLAFQVKA